MDQGPVLVVSFNAQQVIVVKNMKGEIVEGDPVSDTIIGSIYEQYYVIKYDSFS